MQECHVTSGVAVVLAVERVLELLVCIGCVFVVCFFFFQAEDGIRDRNVTGVQTCALPILIPRSELPRASARSSQRTAIRCAEPSSICRTSAMTRSLVWRSRPASRLSTSLARPEERRVGKECRSEGSRGQEGKNVRKGSGDS